MDVLHFVGVISDGVGRFKALRLPGRVVLPEAPADWPEELAPGSLNLGISPGGHPTEFRQRGLAPSVVALDRGLFEPAFEIDWRQIGGNTLTPDRGMPRRGDAQVWRAELRWGVDDVEHIGCWALRRFGSNVGEQLEFVAGERLRDRGLSNSTQVRALLYGKWRDA